MVIVRYADDGVAGFRSKADVSRFLDALKERFAKFGLLQLPRRPWEQLLLEHLPEGGRSVWLQALRRRPQHGRMPCDKPRRVVARYLPLLRVLHPYPNQSFAR